MEDIHLITGDALEITSDVEQGKPLLEGSGFRVFVPRGTAWWISNINLQDKAIHKIVTYVLDMNLLDLVKLWWRWRRHWNQVVEELGGLLSEDNPKP